MVPFLASGMFRACPRSGVFAFLTAKEVAKQFLHLTILFDLFSEPRTTFNHRFCHIVLFFGATKTRKVQQPEPEAAILIIVPFHVSSPVDVCEVCCVFL